MTEKITKRRTIDENDLRQSLSVQNQLFDMTNTFKITFPSQR